MIPAVCSLLTGQPSVSILVFFVIQVNLNENHVCFQPIPKKEDSTKASYRIPYTFLFAQHRLVEDNYHSRNQNIISIINNMFISSHIKKKNVMQHHILVKHTINYNYINMETS